jgi:hypothetical protein
VDEFDDFRRILDERSCLARDCELLGGIVIEPPKRTGFTDSARRRNYPGHGTSASGFPIDAGYYEDGTEGKRQH